MYELKEENKVQGAKIDQAEREISTLKLEVSRLSSKMTTTSSSNSVLQNVTASSKRIIRSTKEEPWSKLQISSDPLGSMFYGHYAINIYGHATNKQPTTKAEEKRYFYTPIARLDHLGATSSYNNVTRRVELRFRVELWNDDVQSQVVKFTSELTKNPSLGSGQVRVLPMEKVMLFSRISSPIYQISRDWIEIQSHRFITCTIICQKLEDCSLLAQEMKTSPDQFDHLKLQFSLSSQTSEKRETPIRIENVVNGDLMKILNQRFPIAENVLLTAEDKKLLLTETLSNIIGNSFDDSAVLPSNLDSGLDSEIESIFAFSRVILQNQSDSNWDALFWNKDNFRPDMASRMLNDALQMVDEERLGISNEATSSASATFDKIYEGNQDNVDWNGDSFVPKTFSLSRISLMRMKDPKIYLDKKIRVSYTPSMLNIRLNVDPHLDVNSTNQLFELQSKLEGIS